MVVSTKHIVWCDGKSSLNYKESKHSKFAIKLKNQIIKIVPVLFDWETVQVYSLAHKYNWQASTKKRDQ